MAISGTRLQQHSSAQHYVGGATTRTSLAITAQLVADRFSAPMVQVNVLTADDQITIAAVGGPLGATPRIDSLCTHVVSEGRPRVLSEISPIPEQLGNIKAYLGVPLTGREGLVIGALCVLDTAPRKFGPADVQELEDVALVVQDQLELRRRLNSVPFGVTGQAADLTAAVRNGQIVPFYQPIVDLATGDVHGVEALARWQHPTRGLLSADAFVPLAEDSDIILDLDLSMLRQAAVQLGRWRIRYPKLRLSVNLSTRHFNHPDCVRRLLDSVEMVGTDPGTVTLELTETAALASRSDDQDYLRLLRKSGFQVVLDDFGSGFASMEQILRLPIDGIKLDRILTSASGSRVGNAVIRHLLGLANDLGLSSVVEGIEHSHQVHQVRREGGTFGQGHVWSPALPAAEMTAYLGRHRSPPAGDVDSLTDLLAAQ